MQDLKELLESMVVQSNYLDPVFAKYTKEELRDIFQRVGWPKEETFSARRAQPIVSEESSSRLVNCLRVHLDDYVDQDKGSIGVAFPVGRNLKAYSGYRDNGLLSRACVLSVEDLGKVLIKGAAVLGPERVAQLMSGWLQGDPVEYKTVALTNAMPVREPFALEGGVRVDVLPLSTDELPSNLPNTIGMSAEDYLGRTILVIDSKTSPPFFQPQAAHSGSPVQSNSGMNLNIATFAQALSLGTNSYVDIGQCWNDYQDLEVFSFTNESCSWSLPNSRIKKRPYRFSLNKSGSTGVTALRPSDEHQTLELRPEQIAQICNGLEGKDATRSRLSLARWIASKDFEKSHVDSLIDLRVALESLYLQHIGDERYRGEMGLRLSLCGAWHLGVDFADRKRIRKTLQNAYHTASKAVHGGNLDRDKPQEILEDAQDLCRWGILKVLREGYPSQEKWGDLILGVDYDEK